MSILQCRLPLPRVRCEYGVMRLIVFHDLVLLKYHLVLKTVIACAGLVEQFCDRPVSTYGVWFIIIIGEYVLHFILLDQLWKYLPWCSVSGVKGRAYSLKL